MTGQRVVVALLVGCLLAGCGSGGGGERAPAARARSADVAWLRLYGRWSGRLRSDMRAAETLHVSLLADDSRAREFAVVVKRLSTCDERYRDHVGRPPNAAWRGPAVLALGACRRFADGERKELQAIGSEAGDLRFAAQAALDKAVQQMFLANDGFEKSFVWNRRLPRIEGVSSRSRIVPLFSQVASAITHKPVEIRCWSAGEWTNVLAEFRAFTARRSDPSEFVDSPELSTSADIGSWACSRLGRLAYRHSYPASGTRFDEMSFAVQTLSHEIQHLVATGTEAQTQCYGMQSLEPVARSLGASSAYARKLALRFWTYWYPNDDGRYHTKLCHDAGPLDAHPSSSRWP